MTKANDRQVGGEHYKSPIQHWDYVWANDLDYFQAQIIKYVTRHRKKNGLEDLAKAKHFLDKYMELVLNEDIVGLTLNDCHPTFDHIGEGKCTCDIKSGCDSHDPDCPLWEGEEPTEDYVNQDRPGRGDTMK